MKCENKTYVKYFPKLYRIGDICMRFCCCFIDHAGVRSLLYGKHEDKFTNDQNNYLHNDRCRIVEKRRECSSKFRRSGPCFAPFPASTRYTFDYRAPPLCSGGVALVARSLVSPLFSIHLTPVFFYPLDTCFRQTLKARFS